MNKGDVYMAQENSNSCVRPIVFVDKNNFNILTTINKRNFIPCSIRGKEHYIVPEDVSIKGIVLHEYVKTIDIQ